MFRYHVRYILMFVAVTSVCSRAIAQTSTFSNPTSERENDPYSRFGLGELTNGNNVSLKGMANITSAYESAFEVNTDNPASYSFLKLTTYEAGATASMRTVANSTESYSTGTATISNINIGIPVGKHAGLCLGLRPYSHVYYNLTDTIFNKNLNPSLGNTARTYSGSGSVNYAFIGGAVQYGSFSVGVNVGYMFGTIRKSSTLGNFDDSLITTFNSDFSQYQSIGGIYWKGGVLYEHNISKNLTLRAGGTLTLSQNLNVEHNEYWVGIYQFSDTLVHDTSYNAQQLQGKIRLPASVSLGVQLASADNWDVGIDYSFSKWTKYSNYPASTDSSEGNGYRDSYNISIGGEFTPNTANLRNYWSHVTYRAGLYYGSDYITLYNNDIKYYGVTLGASFPFKRNTSRVHAAIDLGRLGTKSNGLVQETMFRFSLGMSFNDKWFIKRKYD